MDDLYFFRSDNGQVKIGRSVNVRARLNAVRCSSPVGIMLWASLPERGYEEPAWHTIFHHKLVSGEWFKWCGEIGRAVRLAQNGRDWWKASTLVPDDETDQKFRKLLAYWRDETPHQAAHSVPALGAA